MGDESTKQAAQEYLATKLSEAGQAYEDQQNREAAIALAPAVWRTFSNAVLAKCSEWNAVTEEQTLSCKETALGDLRIWCAGRSQQITVHYDSRKRHIAINNTARLEHEPVAVFQIEGYLSESGRQARLMRNEQPVNIDMVLVGQLRILAGLSRRAEG